VNLKNKQTCLLRLRTVLFFLCLFLIFDDFYYLVCYEQCCWYYDQKDESCGGSDEVAYVSDVWYGEYDFAYDVFSLHYSLVWVFVCVAFCYESSVCYVDYSVGY